MEHFLARFQPSVQVAILLILAILAGLLLYFLFWRVVKTVAGRTATVFDDSLVKHCRRPSIYIFPLLLLHFIMPLFAPHLSEGSNMLLGRSVTILLILTVARLLI